MNTIRATRMPVSIGLLAFVTSVAMAQGSPDTISKILDEGKNRNQGPDLHQRLCRDVGPRLTGSLRLEKGYQWALNRMREIGLTGPHLEQWGTIPTAFDRGDRQSARMVSPITRSLTFTTPCWTNGTTGPVRGKAVRMPASMEELNKMKGQLKGAWVLMPKEVTMRGPDLRRPTELDNEVDKHGIAGRVYSTTGEYVWTHGTWNDYTDETRPKKPLIAITKPDFEAITGQLDAGKAPELEFDIENIITNRQMPAYNIVGEIPGTDLADEIVIVCGHFDSWNGPGSTGASDNGTGTITTLEAARILLASGAKPRRTIRFILWTGEEQGLLGSRQYVEDHAHEMDKISCVLNEDSGQNFQAAIVGLPEMMPILTKAVEPMRTAFPNMEVNAVESERFPRSGSDHVPFIMKGIPGFFLRKGGNLSYGHVWHTQNDKPSEVPPENIRQMSTNMAVLAYNIACADQMVPRVPLELTSRHVETIGGYFEEEDEHPCICGSVIEVGYTLARMGF